MHMEYCLCKITFLGKNIEIQYIFHLKDIPFPCVSIIRLLFNRHTMRKCIYF